MEAIGPVVYVVDQFLWPVSEMKCLQFLKILKFNNFNSKAHINCLNGFMVLLASILCKYFEGVALLASIKFLESSSYYVAAN